MRRPTETTKMTTGRLVLVADMDQLSADRLLWLGANPPECDRLAQAVRTAVATVLTDRQRQVVEAHFFQGLSQSELARQLGVSQQVIQKCLHGTWRNGRRIGGALARLRVALAPLLARPARPARSTDRSDQPGHTPP